MDAILQNSKSHEQAHSNSLSYHVADQLSQQCFYCRYFSWSTLFSSQVSHLTQFILFLFFQLTVFHMNQHEDLDLAILSVLLKGMFTCSPTMVRIGKHFQCTIVNFFLPISLNTCFGFSKEPSH